jgi:hypothetical protein
MNKERVIYYAIITVLMLLLIRSCNNTINIAKDYRKLNEQAQKMIIQHLEDSSTIYSMSIDNRGGELMAQEILGLHKPKEIIKVVTRTVVKTEIKLADPVQFDSTNYLRLPQQFSKSDKWMSIDGRIDTTGTLQIDSFITNGTFTYAVGDTIRSGLFNRIFKVSDPIVRLHIDNPAIQLQGFSNIYARKERKWWQSTGFKIAIGVVAGAAVVNYSH